MKVKNSKKKKKVKEIKKKKKIIEKEKSELEEELENFDEKQNEFIPSFTPVESSAPVLQKVEMAENLETNIISHIRTQEDEKEREIDYARNAPKYAAGREKTQREEKYESDFRAPTLEPQQITDRRKDFFLQRNEPILDSETGKNEIEFRTFEHEQKLPFEQQEKKYKKVKL